MNTIFSSDINLKIKDYCTPERAASVVTVARLGQQVEPPIRGFSTIIKNNKNDFIVPPPRAASVVAVLAARLVVQGENPETIFLESHDL